MTTLKPVGRCPACGEAPTANHTVIEYQTTAGQTKRFTECPACSRVDHPTATPSMQTHDHESQFEELPDGTLSWAFDDEDDPTEITIFDPRNDITTHWITIEKASVCDLNESV